MIRLDKFVAIAGGVSAPVLTLLVDENVLSAVTATDVGAIVAALLLGYHLQNDKARTAIAVADPDHDGVMAPGV